MVSAEREPITGVWGWSPQWGPGAEPLVIGSGGKAPSEAEILLALQHPNESENLALLNDFSVVFKVSNTIRMDPFPLGKPDLGAITMSLDIMMSKTSGYTKFIPVKQQT